MTRRHDIKEPPVEGDLNREPFQPSKLCAAKLSYKKGNHLSLVKTIATCKEHYLKVRLEDITFY